jgi:hypothetical protein
MYREGEGAAAIAAVGDEVFGGPGKSLSLLAERVGFEPTCRNYPTIRFRVGAVMTTSVPLQVPFRCFDAGPHFRGLVF